MQRRVNLKASGIIGKELENEESKKVMRQAGRNQKGKMNTDYINTERKKESKNEREWRANQTVSILRKKKESQN